MLVLMAAGLLSFCGIVGLSIDVGHLVYTRSELQKTSDAAAFAGAQDLPDTSVAKSRANEYAYKNTGAVQTDVTFGFKDGQANKITVKTTRKVNFFFLRAVGLTGSDVNAKATVLRGTYNGGKGLVPWGLIASNQSNSRLLGNSCYLGTEPNGNINFKQNQQCTLKYGAGTSAGGDFGSLALGGTGSDLYRQNVTYGTTDSYVRGDMVEAQTGDMVGPTRQAIADRFAMPPPTGCRSNDRNDVLETNGDLSVSIRPECEDSPRIIIIPVVDQINNPQKSKILGFAFMFLTGYSNTGGKAQVTGEFVKFVTEIPGGIYNGTGAGATALTLVE